VLSEKKILDEKKPSCKINGRSLIKMQISNLERFWIEEKSQMIEKIINSRKSTA
jgi:hypothetical protein